ncbi:hypothetical protein QBC41DRAFT_368084 [Cercophora samala]|uniref:Uncharacterized protein n=1 Tax=Cercophora samala TaxID=330535 RepID=A0AA39Z4C0_9PEZI|nr:hypothetical protein QBC41DRAFT_368084 [Cercophora samala]
MADIAPLLELHKNNATALRTEIAPAWVEDAPYRGTASILWSCVVALAACVYSTLHLNIPAPGRMGYWPVFWKKTGWVFTVLFAPEVVLVVACGEFLKARWLQCKLRALNSSEPKAGDVSLRYCFFVVMGGLKVLVGDLITEAELKGSAELRKLFRDSTAVLSPEGVVQLARLGHMLNVADTTIDDRSKASIVQKFVVLTQVFWLLLHCIVRLAQGLPLALLEVHISVHIVVAGFMYAFWLQKPLDVVEGMILDRRPWESALMLMVELAIYKHSELYLYRRFPTEEPVVVDSKKELQDFYFGDLIEKQVKAMKWVALPSTGGCLEADEVLPSGIGFKGRRQTADISPTQLARLDGIASVLGDVEQGNSHTGSGFLILPVLYGGIHLFAWNFPFVTENEMMFWKISCITVMTGTVLVTPVVILLDRHCTGTQRERLWFIPIAICFLYIFARVFIVVESFISLRGERIGVFLSPPWLQNFPHV